MKSRTAWSIAIPVLATCLIAGAETKPIIEDPIAYPTTDKRHYLEPKDINFVRPGLIISVGPEDVSIAGDGTVSITFSITDDRGLPLDRDGVFTPGSVSLSFILANIPDDMDQYSAYTVRTQTSPITGDSAVQPSADSGGTFEELEVGTYRYTFGTKLPAGFDATSTHTIGIYASRNLDEFELGSHVANELVHFVPAGGEPMPRQVTTTQACNSCHDPLALHGGSRREVGLCILCHTEGVEDPDTGNSVDMEIMIHKIHMGENLPSVEAGVPYQIIGFRQSVHDYSHVVFPQDIRNCETCHVAEAAQSHKAYSEPAMDSCGSCHDDVVFVTGENHVGGPAVSNRFCANCHFPEGELEFDASVMGAHTIPSESTQLAGINIEILEVTDGFPGELPTVRFSLTNDAGMPIDISGLRSFTLLIAGPNESYDFLARENAMGAMTTAVEGEYTYTFETALPEFAMGSYTVGAEASRNVTLNAGTTDEFTHRETADPNPTFAFAVTDTVPMERRVAVTDEKCENCHENLELHGGQRHGPQYCVMCHTAVASDIDRRPESELPPRSIHFKFMIHRIHRGEDMTRDYTIYGFGGTPHNYNEVLFPGDLRNCETCHVNDTQQVPSAGLLATTATENEFFNPITPDAAACLGCHDTLQAAAHAFLNIAPFGEACAACHGPGKEASVDKVHARLGE